MNKFILSFAACSLAFTAGCSTMMPPSYYEGGKQPDEEMAIYTLQMASSFWSSARTYTIDVDGQPTAEMVAMKISGEAFGNIALKPGKHVMRVSFIDIENVLLPTFLKENKFQGVYAIEAELRPGQFYGIRFKEHDNRVITDEMCLVGVGQSEGITALRDQRNYLACGRASMPATQDNIKTCKQYLGSFRDVANHPENCSAK